MQILVRFGKSERHM